MFRSNIDYIVVGLGNFGAQYHKTRHNVGFMVLDEISQQFEFEFNKQKFKSLIEKTSLFDKKILFMKPLTYMNNSGEAVADAMNFYKLSAQNLIVVYDDITLDLGKIKIKHKGSAGGHNGIKSIINLIGGDIFVRVKVGISQKPHGYCLADWVLSKFKPEEEEKLGEGISFACDALKSLLKDDLETAMNQFNRKK